MEEGVVHRCCSSDPDSQQWGQRVLVLGEAPQVEAPLGFAQHPLRWVQEPFSYAFVP